MCEAREIALRSSAFGKVRESVGEIDYAFGCLYIHVRHNLCFHRLRLEATYCRNRIHKKTQQSNKLLPEQAKPSFLVKT